MSIFEIPQDSYDNLFNRFENNMTFRGYTLKEWSEMLELKDLSPDFSSEDLERYNLRVTNHVNLISNNFALASANYTGLKKSVEKAMMVAKQAIMDEIDEHNSMTDSPAQRKRYPSNEKLEAEAYNRVLQLQLDCSIAEMFYTFFEVHWKRIQLVNTRVTSLSVMRNNEFKTTI